MRPSPWSPGGHGSGAARGGDPVDQRIGHRAFSPPLTIRRARPRASASDHCEAFEALRALSGLPERKRTFLTLKVAGYGYHEIAPELGVSWLTINRHLVRARATLRTAR
jgi:DNA-directed RNA polymerase specialized sigma24 family protein